MSDVNISPYRGEIAPRESLGNAGYRAGGALDHHGDQADSGPLDRQSSSLRGPALHKVSAPCGVGMATTAAGLTGC